MEQELFTKLRGDINALVIRRERDFKLLCQFVRATAQRIRSDTNHPESCLAGCVDQSGKFCSDEYLYTNEDFEFALQIRFPGPVHPGISFTHDVLFKIIPDGNDFKLTRVADGVAKLIQRQDLGDPQTQKDVASLVDLPVVQAVEEILKS